MGWRPIVLKRYVDGADARPINKVLAN